MSSAKRDPSQRAIVKFGDVVKCMNRTTKDPAGDGLERVVGLEHMDPESLPLRRWDSLGDLSDGTSFTRTFSAGQVLFGKRRAYQRKVSVPSFDGLCSGDILVFEASGAEMDEEFLPYVVQSNGFFEHALGTSAGSLSPRTKWQELAKYEFSLPSRHEQAEIAEVLKCASTVLEATKTVADQATLTLSLFAEALIRWDETFRAELNLACVEFRRLSDVAKLKRGRFSHRPRNEPRLYATSGEYPFVQTGDIERSGGQIDSFSQFLSEEGTRYSRAVDADTLLVTIAAVIGATARTTCRTYLPDSIVSVDSVKHVTTTDYLELALRGLRKHLENTVATENTQKNLSVEKLGGVEIPVPPSEIQNALVRRAQSFQSLISSAEADAANAGSLLTSLRETLLKGG